MTVNFHRSIELSLDKTEIEWLSRVYARMVAYVIFAREHKTQIIGDANKIEYLAENVESAIFEFATFMGVDTDELEKYITRA